MPAARVLLPYCSWDAAHAFLGHLAKGDFPGSIDESVFPPDFNPATIEQVRQSLRRLALVGKGGTPTPALRRVLSNGVDGWREVLRELYKKFFKIGWETMTSKQFVSLLEEHGATGETALRAGRFVLQALRYSDIPYSSMLGEFGKGSKRTKPPGRETSPYRDSTQSSTTYKGKLDFGQFQIELEEHASDRDLKFLQGVIDLQRRWKRVAV